jgi:2-alkenal reductase
LDFVFLLGILVVFLVLAAQFESYINPLVIMLTVPLAIAGGLLGLYLTGSTLNLYSQIGLVMLVGLAAKNGILIVEFANQLRERRKSFDYAILKASEVRLRPIVMTGITTATGAIPLILSTGAGAETRMVIGVVVLAGVLSATLFTLFVVPVAYRLLSRRTHPPGQVARLNAAAPSVVYIFTENAVAGFFGAREVRQGAGSGFLWDSSGHVVTNFHVIEGARRVQVRLESGEAIDATYVGGTPDYDLAVIRLRRPLSTIQPIPVGRSDNLQVGQSVLAIGNPFGLSRTLTTGVISALDRRLPTATGRDVVGVIQTDAAINPGNSGGPLIDSGGRLIGVNTAIISGSGSSAGIGFAVPVDVVNKVVPQLIAKGKFPRPGIGIVVLDEEATASLGVVGVVIDRVVPDSEAQRAGLEGIDYRRRVLGDTIVAVEGKPITNMADFVQMMQAFDIGQPISLQVRRGDTLRDVTVTIMDIS